MVDLTIEPYAGEESLERIMRTLLGEDLSAVAKTQLDGRQYSADEAFAAIAMLMQGNLVGQQLQIPLNMSLDYSQIYAEYATGSSQSLASGTWSEVDPWSADGLSSSNMTPDFANNQIIVDEAGIYFVGFQMSVKLPAGTLTTLHVQATLDSSRQPAVHAQRGIGATDTVMNTLSGLGILDIAAGQDLQLYALSENVTRTMQVFQAQLVAIRLGPIL